MAEEFANADSLEAILAQAGKRLEYGVIETIQLPTLNTQHSTLNTSKLKQFPEVAEALNILYNGAVASAET